MLLPFRRRLRRVWRACEGDVVGKAVHWSAPDVSSGLRVPPVESATATRKCKCIVRAIRRNQRSMITLVAAGRIVGVAKSMVVIRQTTYLFDPRVCKLSREHSKLYNLQLFYWSFIGRYSIVD